ncbi:hypothetical protein L1F33_00985 [Qipengyuania spongiae]|uniref:HTH hxlR-type domain-containing protein n=1 Tax=Qipengyuania spongiae TaxID=2909673 RepID=A0ABY5T2G1_9SPHN|nr:hypothetical protein [Qipengyuania spongiae]UVI40709.1 hypothetical protein L1F33_00985 [Qipengyuania spongiae]
MGSQDYLKAEWQQSAERGRPPRHAYRLTADGKQGVAIIAMAGGLLATAVFGSEVEGAARWVSLGGLAIVRSMSFSAQPGSLR